MTIARIVQDLTSRGGRFTRRDFDIIADALEKANDGCGLIFGYSGRQDSRVCSNWLVRRCRDKRNCRSLAALHQRLALGIT